MSGVESLSPRAEMERRILEAMRFRLGPVVRKRLDDPQVVEIMLNPDGAVWEDRLGVGMSKIGSLSDEDATSFIGMVASCMFSTVNRKSPILSAEIPFRGARLEAMTRPVVSSPIFNIRMRALRVFSLDDYERDRIITSRQRRVIEDAARQRINVVVSGGTGGGKSTLLNTITQLQAQYKPQARVVILEDTVELQCNAENFVQLRTTEGVTLRHLVRESMRLRPDTIIVGEIRGGEAHEMLKAWNTGHDGGLTSVHSDKGKTLGRIEDLVSEASPGDRRRQIADTIDLIIQIERTPTSRVVSKIIRVHGFNKPKDDYELEELEL